MDRIKAPRTFSVSIIPFRVDTPRLAASTSYRRKPVSRGPDWIPCQARNDGPEQKTIPRGLPRGGFIIRVAFGKRLAHPCAFLQSKRLQSIYLSNYSYSYGYGVTEIP